jgi:formamidopyrimidine-DNA glycosylase
MDAQFTADFLQSVLSQRQAPIKALLMDQKLIAGLGNIYATEALHFAGIRPDRRAGSLTRPQIDRLTQACRHVLELGITLGGSTLDDESFLDPLGLPGQMQKHVKIYGRRQCDSCGSKLKATRKKISGRTSLYCPSCQS